MRTIMDQLFSNADTTNQDGVFFSILTSIKLYLLNYGIANNLIAQVKAHLWHLTLKLAGFHYKLYSSKDLCCCTRTKHIWENDDWLKTAWRTKERGKTSKSQNQKHTFWKQLRWRPICLLSSGRLLWRTRSQLVLTNLTSLPVDFY